MSCDPSPWVRARFHADKDDWRPVKWPPPGPCWCTGYGDDHSTVVAYVRNEAQIKEYWPEAHSVTTNEALHPEFSERFPKPKWWKEETKP